MKLRAEVWARDRETQELEVIEVNLGSVDLKEETLPFALELIKENGERLFYLLEKIE